MVKLDFCIKMSLVLTILFLIGLFITCLFGSIYMMFGNIENLIDELGISSEVILLGVRRDVKEVMCASDCLVLSSSFEGFGLVLAEAMACSRLVVTTDCGGTKQVVGDCGYVVPPMDSTALASAMLSASRLSPQSRKIQGEVGRDRVVKQFSLDAVVDKWVKIYENL